MNRKISRVVLAGTQSGSGKTTITCGILQMLKNRNRNLAAFKCGPDYIDPMFHKSVLGIDGSNLDLFLFASDMACHLLQKNMESKDLAVIEGVMGYYDGIGEDGTGCSTYEVAKTINAPTILIVPCDGASTSALAIVKGFLEYKQDSNIQGIIFNQMHAVTYQQIKKIWEQQISDQNKSQGTNKPTKMPVLLGHIPKIPEELRFESRHLGLVTAMEISKLREKLENLAAFMESTVDIEGILKIANNAESMEAVTITSSIFKNSDIKKSYDQRPIRVAIAKDEAFCFYYKDNLDLLKHLGIELVEFSPIRNSHLPVDIAGLILGGGYPELHLKELSSNTSLMNEIRELLESGLPCIAECGGFMYLNQSIDEYPMVGYLQGKCSNQSKLVRFGYTTLTSVTNNMLCKVGEQLRGHEFHYYDCTKNGDCYQAAKQNGTVWKSVIANDHLYAGYPHLHFYSNPNAALRFYEKCVEYCDEVNNELCDFDL